MKTLFQKANRNAGYLFIMPWIIGFFLFTAFPVVYSLYLSLTKVTITSAGIHTQWVAGQNFISAVTGDLDFLNNLLSFTKEVFISVPLIVVLALIIALLLIQPIKGRGFFRTIFFLPVIISSGPVLSKLMALGVTTIPSVESFILYKLAASSTFPLSGIFIYVIDNLVMLMWFSGVQILIFIAALQKIDPNVYEAARIDGASKWEIFWKITLSFLLPMIVVNLVYTTVMYSVSSVNPVIEVIKNNMFKMQTGFGYSSALAWIYFIVITLILLLILGVIRFFDREK